MIEVFLPNGHIKRYKNILFKQCKIQSMHLHEKNFEGKLNVVWEDGAFCQIAFSDLINAKRYIRNHKKFIGISFKLNNEYYSDLLENDSRICVTHFVGKINPQPTKRCSNL